MDRPAPHTFATKRDADLWLTRVESDMIAGSWRDPDLGTEQLGGYLTDWIDHRPNLRPRTVDLYRWLNRKYIEPTLSGKMLKNITPGMVREWRANLLADGIAATMVAKAYRLLRAVLNTAVDDELIRRNPCRIPGAGTERPAERPTATVAQVLTLADTVPARFRALILLAAFTGLRYGELAALRRQDVGEDFDTIDVRATLVERSTGELLFGPPKTDAGVRRVTVPKAIRPDVSHHFENYVGDAADALVFTTITGAVLRRSGFQRSARWTQSVIDAGLPGFHFHDLRHTGNKLAAPGSSLADLMARMGHASTRAAMIYQHAAQEQDREIADRLSGHIKKERDRARNGHAQPRS
ncbi:tyrosine-type recombinase/integrase [Pilimelia anulata]|nr:tyrosine-type recombinase/integrase [Pilimelia anulata]